ncbi:EDC1 [Candida margitis]|uniref:EDC1 n=1 Tax=Candida margitis TaxID=1775924 RepID=UPI002226C0C1|nr:EDC1 [Candida margitis]KAI5953979.1 EDC1 [Candida margitis]
MMAHEISTPIPIHGNENNASFQNMLKKPSRQHKKKQTEGHDNQVRVLPSGAPVDFGNGPIKNKNKNKNNSPKKLKEPIKLSSLPSLPNGEKPQFYNDKSDSRRKKDGEQNPAKALTRSKKSQKGDKPSVVEPSLPNGEKPNFNNNSKPSKKANNKKEKGPVAVVLEEDSSTYAGSSFHSSPAALNLPKPNFKPSPKQIVGKEDTDVVSSKSIDVSTSKSSVAPISTPVGATQSPSSPATTMSYSPRGYPSQPIQPVYLGPHASQQAIYAPQGCHPFQSHYVPQPVPPPLPPNQFYNPYLAPVPHMHYPPPSQLQPNPQGQKITFNQLLSSSK